MDLWMTFKDRLRYFNKWVTNHVTMIWAGRRHSPYSVVYHVGRTSGRTYATPVSAVSADDVFAIPLPYGTETDWCRNVLASGSCLIEHEGAVYRAVNPAIVGPERGVPIFPVWIRAVLRRVEVDHYLRLQRAAQVQPDEPAYRHVRAAHEDDTKLLMILAAVITSLIALGVHIRRKKR
jgi:deazaflavin-dependent oxidoreductase (nitroreductase family)